VKKPLTKEQHRETGIMLASIRDEVGHIMEQLDAAYARKELTKRLRAIQNEIDILRDELLLQSMKDVPNAEYQNEPGHLDRLASYYPFDFDRLDLRAARPFGQ
jgi:hypothetical protein